MHSPLYPPSPEGASRFARPRARLPLYSHFHSRTLFLTLMLTHSLTHCTLTYNCTFACVRSHSHSTFSPSLFLKYLCCVRSLFQSLSLSFYAKINLFHTFTCTQTHIVHTYAHLHSDTHNEIPCMPFCLVALAFLSLLSHAYRKLRSLTYRTQLIAPRANFQARQA